MVYKSYQPSEGLVLFGRKLDDRLEDAKVYGACLSYEMAKRENEGLRVECFRKNHESLLEIISSMIGEGEVTFETLSDYDYAGILESFESQLRNKNWSDEDKSVLFKMFLRRNILSSKIVQLMDTDLEACREMGREILEIDEIFHTPYREIGIYMTYSTFS